MINKQDIVDIENMTCIKNVNHQRELFVKPGGDGG
jgi:hypothetical protein